MRVVLVSQYFPPETGGPPNRAVSLARGLLDAGHVVEVVCEKPSHPEGRIRAGYRGGLAVHRRWEGIPVHYVWVRASLGKTLWARVANHLSFLFTALLTGLRLPGRIDVVLSTSPPLFAAAAGWWLARLRRAAHVLDVRDLWPDIAVAMGELQNPVWIRLAKRLERALYRNADAITAVTQSFCDTIAPQAKDPRAVHLIRNGSVPDFFAHRGDAADARRRLGWPDDDRRFVVAYVGNIGLAQGLDHAVDAARLLADTPQPARVLLVGSGPAVARLQERASRGAVANLEFWPRVDQDHAADWMAAADALVVSLANLEMLAQFVPSKLYDAMASGRPVLLGARGEAQTMLETAGAGIAYAPESATGLADAVRRLQRDPDLCARLGRRGAAFARQHCDRAQHARALVALLQDVVRRREKSRAGDLADQRDLLRVGHRTSLGADKIDTGR